MGCPHRAGAKVKGGNPPRGWGSPKIWRGGMRETEIGWELSKRGGEPTSFSPRPWLIHLPPSGSFLTVF